MDLIVLSFSKHLKLLLINKIAIILILNKHLRVKLINQHLRAKLINKILWQINHKTIYLARHYLQKVKIYSSYQIIYLLIQILMSKNQYFLTLHITIIIKKKQINFLIQITRNYQEIHSIKLFINMNNQN